MWIPPTSLRGCLTRVHNHMVLHVVANRTLRDEDFIPHLLGLHTLLPPPILN